MNDKLNNDTEDTSIADPGQAIDMVQDTLDTFLSTANVSNVFGTPIEHGETKIIPAAELLVGVGFGAGYGVSGPAVDGGGGGGGGGGRTLSRPVAVIIASPEGVRVEPVFDITKILLTALTAAGFIFSTIIKISRMGQQKN